jgi:hypothetical protein
MMMANEYDHKFMESLNNECQQKFLAFKAQAMDIGNVVLPMGFDIAFDDSKSAKVLIITSIFLRNTTVDLQKLVLFSSKIRRTGFDFKPYFGEKGERSNENMIFRLVGKFINSI